MKIHAMTQLFTIISLLFLSLALPTAAFAKKPEIIKMVIATPENDWPQTHRDVEMANRFNDRANGEYRIEVYTGGALAKLPEFFDAVRVGAVDMQFSNWGMFAFLDPRMGLLELPFLLESNEATNEAAEKLLPIYDEILAERFNAKALAMTNTGPIGFWTRTQVTNLEDLQEMLMAAVSPTSAKMVQTLGASPMTIAFPDIYESMQKKIVDGATMSSHGGIALSYYHVTKHYTSFYGIQSFAGYTINQDVWRKMPARIQNILIEETTKAAEWMNQILQTEMAENDLKTFKKNNVSVYYLSRDERQRWVDRFIEINSETLEKYGDLGEKIKRIVDQANRKYPYEASVRNL